MSKCRVIVNPTASNGRTGRIWPELAQRLKEVVGEFEVSITAAKEEAERWTREALHAGCPHIISVGGDGTANEIVNGFFENGVAVHPDARLSIVMTGTGCDYARSLGLPRNPLGQIDRIANNDVRQIDVGNYTYTDATTGVLCTRYFHNTAGFGLSGATALQVNRATFSKRLGGKLAFQWGLLKALYRQRSWHVRLQVDDQYEETLETAITAVCVGPYFGGGMRVAPDAALDDGLFDIVIIHSAPLLELAWKSRLLYPGKHVDDPKVSVLRGRRVVAAPVEDAVPAPLEIDGETPGFLPTTFEIVPQAIRVSH